ncbi:MAG: hypothetical protein R2788_02780 [Saprospiraceae bacterium]
MISHPGHNYPPLFQKFRRSNLACNVTFSNDLAQPQTRTSVSRCGTMLSVKIAGSEMLASAFSRNQRV